MSRVGVVDDDVEARQSYAWTLEDADVEPADEDGPLGDLESYASTVVGRLDAVLCDHHLKVSNYAQFEGVELAAKLYEKKVPAILCTSWATAELDFIRKFRDRVPVLLRPEELEPETFMAALRLTIDELEGTFTPERRPWRTLVHVAEVDPEGKFFYIRLPSWTSDEIIKLRQMDLPERVRKRLGRDHYLHADVNIGSEVASDVYFVNWESE